MYYIRRAGELTDLALPDRIVRQACQDCKARDRDKQAIRYTSQQFKKSKIKHTFVNYVYCTVYTIMTWLFDRQAGG